jgi:signal transduction histidine kinase
MLPGLLSAMNADALGRLWVATADRLFRVGDAGRIEVPLGSASPPRHIVAIASDARGGQWLGDAEQGLLHLRGDRLERLSLPADVNDVRIVTLATDRAGSLWATFANGRVVTIDKDGRLHSYGRNDGLDAGVYRLLYQDRHGAIWLGGTDGLTRFVDGRFATLRIAYGFPTEAPTGLAEDDRGDLWLGAEGSGIVRVARDELERAFASRTYQVRYRVFDKLDGFAGTARWFGNRGAVRTHGDRLWFVSGRGVTVVDPATLPEGPAASARVRIEGAIADGDRIHAVNGVALPVRTSSVQIDYAVLSLDAPPRTEFRYRLEGFDAGWIAAGSRRQAFYTNLPPRSYVFRAIASNDDGSWSERAGVWAFTIPPAFYQTSWFAVVCLLGVAAAIGVVWRLHVRRVRRQFSLLLGERARLSREIHDTLLQGLFGVALRCDNLARSLEATAPWLQQHFVEMRRDIQDYIQEARQSIQDLRSPRLAGRELSEALRDSLARATSGTQVSCEVSVVGTPHGCPANVEQQLLRIGEEAVANAVRHAAARVVRVELHYDGSLVTLRIADDGRGFDPRRVSEAGGHFGLAGMRERAASVGGTLRVTSGDGRGAQIEAVVPRC